MIRDAQLAMGVITVGLNRLVHLEQCCPGPLLAARRLQTVLIPDAWNGEELKPKIGYAWI